MFVTFFIGNGFDLNIGLNTRYVDFLPYFVDNASNDNLIKNWIKDDDITLWSDFEKKLGLSLDKVNTSNLDAFYESNSELNRLLGQYLKAEQNRIESSCDSDDWKKEMIRSLDNFDFTFSRDAKQAISQTIMAFRSETLQYQFVSFNYTDVLDMIVSNITNSTEYKLKKRPSNAYNDAIGNVYHIHGKTNEEMIIGVNDESQINNKELLNNNEFLDTIIKTRINERIGQQKTEDVNRIVDSSRIICIFGMSLGDTDTYWWEIIVDWLARDKKNLLIIYRNNKDEWMVRKDTTKLIRSQYRNRTGFLEKGKKNKKVEELHDYENQIIIGYNPNIFQFGVEKQ